MTAMMVRGRPSTVTLWPTADDLPPKRRCQYPYDRMAVFGEPGVSSGCENHRPNAECLQDAVGGKNNVDLLRLGDAGNARAAFPVETDILEDPIVLAIGEVHGGRALDVALDSGHARRRVPHTDQVVCPG